MNILKKFMTFPKGSVGISFQADGMSLAHIEKSKGSTPQLNHAEFLSFQDPKEGTDLLKSAFSRWTVSGQDCVAVLDPGSYQLLQVETPELSEEEIRSAVRWQVKDLLSYPIDEAVLDVFLIPWESSRHRARTAYVAAAPKDIILERIELLHDAKMKVKALDIPEMVLRNISVLLPEAEEGMAFISLQESNGLVLLIRDSVVYLTRKINFGLREIFQTPAESEYGGEEGVERERGGSYHLENLVLEIQRSLDFFESNFNLPSISHLVVAPSEMDYPVLLPFLQKNLGINVRQFDTGEIFENTTLSPFLQARCLTAIGGALRSFGGEL